MEKIILRTEYIKLGQALKASGLVDSGAEAKEVIINGHVKINGQIEYQRGKKLYDKDIIEYNNKQLNITK